MRRMLLGSLFLGLCLSASAAPAEKPVAEKPVAGRPVAEKPVAGKPVMVMIGSTPCFYIRANDGTATPQQRSDRILDVFNKYLGGSKATFAVKPVGKKTGIYMNGDLAIAVTPEDVKASKAKSVSLLATSWKTLLTKAFNDTKAIK
jgi:hypothetical protein